MSDSQLAVRPKASQQLAALVGMEPNAMLDTIKGQCFKCPPQNVSNEQLAAFVSIAAEMGVNPLLPGMLYAFPVQGGGIIPIMGPSGVYKKLMEHPEVDSWSTTVYPEDVALPPTHAVTEIYRKGREKPLKYTALLSEWKVDSNPNWRTRPRHMLSLRSLKHCAAQIIHGIPGDEDDRVIAGEINVTPEVAPITRAEPPPRKTKGVNATKTETAIDVSSTPVAERGAEGPKTEHTKPAQMPEPAPVVAEPVKERVVNTAVLTPVAEPAPEAEVAVGLVAPRTSLNDGEEMTETFEVRAVEALVIKKAGIPTTSVQVELSGFYSGIAYHLGGVKDAPWKAGESVKATLRGKLAPKAGVVQVWVEKVEASAATVEA